MKREYLTTAIVQTKPVAGIKEIIESLHKETKPQKNTPDKKASISPAPFYDELHFANYE